MGAADDTPGPYRRPYRVLVTGGGGAVMSLRFFRSAPAVEAFIQGVMVGYWWRPVTVQHAQQFPGKKPPAQPEPVAPAKSTRLQVWWDEQRLIDRPLHEMTAADMAPLSELWRKVVPREEEPVCRT